METDNIVFISTNRTPGTRFVEIPSLFKSTHIIHEWNIVVCQWGVVAENKREEFTIIKKQAS